MRDDNWRNGDIVEFDVDGGVEMTMIKAHINVQKRDLGGGCMPSE
jgi:hypothetical protein